MKPMVKKFIAPVILAAVAYGGWLAYSVEARKAAAPPTYQGYVEGEFVQISSAVAGRLTVLAVQRGDSVQTGNPLFCLEDDYETAALLASEAEFAAAEAQLADMQTGLRSLEIAVIEDQLDQAQAVARDSSLQLERDMELYRSRSIPKSQLDKSQADDDANRARVRELEDNIAVAHLPDRDKQIEAQTATVRAAEAKVEQARWTLAQKQVFATRNGQVYDVVYRVGEWIPAGQPVVRLLPPENIKIRFYVPEPVLASLRVGQIVLVGRDGTEPTMAAISYISNEAEYTPPVIYSNESRYKLCYMIEAQTGPETAANLHPGQPVFVELR